VRSSARRPAPDPRRATTARRWPLVRVLALAALAAAAVGTVVDRGHVLAGVEQDTVELRFALRGPQTVGDLAVVGIDDVTFSDLQVRWPFRRRLHARAIDALRRAGARVVVYDVQFTEPSGARDDAALFAAVRRAAPRVVLVTSETDGHGHTNVLGGDRNVAAAGARAASSNLPTGRDGVLGRVAPSSGGLATTAVVAARTATGRVPPADRWPRDGARINFAGPPRTVPTYAFSDLLAGRIPDGALRGRIVVVGATAQTLQDVHATPMSHRNLMSGPEVQANAIRTALRGLPLRDAPGWAAAIAVLLLAAAPAALALRLRAPAAALAAVGVGALYAGLAQLAFDHGAVLALTGPLSALLAGTAAMVTASYAVERGERERVDDLNHGLERLVRERTEDLRATQLEVIERLAQAVDSRDGDTGGHIARMSALCERLALALGLGAAEAERLRQASALHDVGKLAVPDAILHKPGRLDAGEWAVMQRHAEIGAQLLAGSRSSVMQLAESVARTHHERWDGAGYPAGLAGAEIPIEGRIAAVADVFDALLSPRPYKDAWPLADALAEVERQAGTQFDPAVARALLDLVADPRAAAELGLPATPEATSPPMPAFA
jgi:CHASE2 domain-containing sensor protein